MKVFDIVAVSETRIVKKTSFTSPMNLHTAGGDGLFSTLASHLSYKSQNK